MLKNVFLRLKHALAHIRNGSVLDRVALEWRKRARERRVRWWKSQIGKRQYCDTKIDQGARIRLYFDSELARLIYCDDFEIGERHFVSAFLRPGDAFVDVGANIGLFSLVAANRVGDSGKVYAFEPSGKTFHRLRENTKLNILRNVQCIQLALSDESGESPFYISEDGFDAWNSIARPIAGKLFAKEIVQCETWDRFARAHDLVGRVTMMKIDVEGWETRVLEGAKEHLSRQDAPLLQVEFTEEAAVSAGSSCKGVYRALENFGYRMFTYDSRKRELVHDPLRENYPYINLIATKRPEETNIRLRKSLFRRWSLGK